MSTTARYSIGAVLFLVVLRLALGWQLLYEGMWKISTLDSARPWTSAGYLKNSEGPMRDTFRNLAGDADDLDWLNYDVVSARWKAWEKAFADHYELDDKQEESLKRLVHGGASKVDGRMAFAEVLDVPAPAAFGKSATVKKYMWANAEKKRVYIDADQILDPTLKATIQGMAKIPSLTPESTEEEKKAAADARRFRDVVEKLYQKQKRSLGYLRKLRGAVLGNPDVTGIVYINGSKPDTQDLQQVGQLDDYREQLRKYEQKRAAAKTSFEWEQLAFQWKEIQTLRTDLSGPIKAMEASLKEDAQKILSVDQHASGPVPEPWTDLEIADTLTIVGLTTLGLMLLMGLFSRFAAVAAAFMLFGFYLAMPPLPGVPPAPGPEHSLFVNKNLIEVFALLVLAATPSGHWFGVDSLLTKFFANWRSDGKVTKDRQSTISTGEEPATATA